MDSKAGAETAASWLAAFADALDRNDMSGAAELFLDDCYWRDLLAFTWNIKTMEGRDAIRAMLPETLGSVRPTGWALKGPATSDGETVEAWFTFETAVAWGEGHVRLRDGRCFTLFTATTDLKGYEEPVGATRPLGVTHKAAPDRETWSEARAREQATLGISEQPYCVVIGGGQGGIAMGARLKQLGVPSIILEKNARAGDSWRNRYRSLVLHDPVWYYHLPYIPFPEHWPVYTPKDRMGDWLEMYVKVMALDYWTQSTVTRASYDESARIWTVEVLRDGATVVLTPKHLVFATGAYGPARPIDLPGMDDFRGRILHSSQYASGEEFRGSKCAVLGTASSGHDVSVDLWEAGADVTMVQRAPTTVVRSETMMELVFAPLYSQAARERGISTERADMIDAALPFALATGVHTEITRRVRQRDAAFYAKLAASGLRIDFGEDESGLIMKAMRTGSGYYIDVGASQLIIDGQIKVRSGAAIETLTADGVRFDDGSEIEADAIIACTGYGSMHETIGQIVSPEVGDKVGKCWGLGSGVRGDPGPWLGEPRNMWKPTAQEALWCHGGNLALSRFYSRYVALQIKARMEGIETPVYGAPG